MMGVNGVTTGSSVDDLIIPSLGLVIFAVCCTSEIMDSILTPSVFEEFDTHSSRLKDAARARKESVRCRNVVEDSEDGEAITALDTLGKKQYTDTYDGDTNLRTLRTLLSMIDDRGWERSPHQVTFHEKFEQCVSRVLYKGEWATQRPAIMKKNGWDRCASEVMISTPRRFGKTFSIAIFCACLALSLSCEIVIFSPARRASRKLLERVVEFIRVLDCDDHIVEYNQEACRVVSFNGAKKSLIRSFPSKVGVSRYIASSPVGQGGVGAHTHMHAAHINPHPRRFVDNEPAECCVFANELRRWTRCSFPFFLASGWAGTLTLRRQNVLRQRPGAPTRRQSRTQRGRSVRHRCHLQDGLQRR